uniref:Uncharacterized protein n=1 Tax=Anguilla anguilla TaxID=7936 RepID=A0A0E9RTR9_ANGAN
MSSSVQCYEAEIVQDWRNYLIAFTREGIVPGRNVYFLFLSSTVCLENDLVSTSFFFFHWKYRSSHSLTQPQK